MADEQIRPVGYNPEKPTYSDLDKYLISWYKAYHLLNAPDGVRKKWESQRSEKGQTREGTDYVVVTERTQDFWRKYVTQDFKSTFVVRNGDVPENFVVNDRNHELATRISLGLKLKNDETIGKKIRVSAENIDWLRNAGLKDLAIGKQVNWPSKIEVTDANRDWARVISGNDALKTGEEIYPGQLTDLTREAYREYALPGNLADAINSVKIGERIWLNDGRSGTQKLWALNVSDTIRIVVDHENLAAINEVFDELDAHDGQKKPKKPLELDDKIDLPARLYERLAVKLPKKYEQNRLGGLYDELPPIDSLGRAQQEEFYIICQKALRGIKYDGDTAYGSWFRDPSVPQPIAKLLGDKRYFAFSEPEPTNALKEEIAKLRKLLNDDKDSSFRDYLLNGTGLFKTGKVFADSPSRTKFITDINNDKWLSNLDTKLKLREVLDVVEGYGRPEVRYNALGLPEQPTKEESAKYEERAKKVKDINPDFIKAEITKSEEKYDDRQFYQFMSPGKDGTPAPYEEILKALYDVKKEDRLSDFGKKFADNDGPKVTKALTEVSGKIKYDAMARYLKDYESRNFMQGLKKGYNDFMDDHVRKLYKKHLGHPYLDFAAKGIVDALFEEKFNPTEGLDGILAKKDAIKKGMANSKYQSGSEKGFDLLCDCLNLIKEAGSKNGMDNAYKGALRNGKQNAAVAKFIIGEAVRRGDISEGMAALEALAVLMYDPFDSQHRKELGKTRSNLFKDMTFTQNNAPLKFVFGAADRMIDWSLMGVYNIGVMVRNLYQSKRGKLTPEDIEFLQKSMRLNHLSSMGFKNPKEAKKALEQAEAQIISAEKDLKKAETALAAKEAQPEIKELLDKKKLLDDKDDGTLDKEAEALNKQIAEADMYQKAVARAEVLTQKLKEMAKKPSARKKSFAAKTAATRNKINSLEGERDSLQEANQELEKEAALQEYELDKLKAKQKALEENLSKATAKTEINKINKDIKANLNAINIAEKTLESTKKSIASNKGKIDRIGDRINNASNGYNQMRREYDDWLSADMSDEEKADFKESEEDEEKGSKRAELLRKKQETAGLDEMSEWYGAEGLQDELDGCNNIIGRYQSLKDFDKDAAQGELNAKFNSVKNREKDQKAIDSQLKTLGYAKCEKDVIKANMSLSSAEWQRDQSQKYLNANAYRARKDGLEKSVDEKESRDLQLENREYNTAVLTMFYNAARGLDTRSKEVGIKFKDWDVFHKPQYGGQNKIRTWLADQNGYE